MFAALTALPEMGDSLTRAWTTRARRFKNSLRPQRKSDESSVPAPVPSAMSTSGSTVKVDELDGGMTLKMRIGVRKVGSLFLHSTEKNQMTLTWSWKHLKRN